MTGDPRADVVAAQYEQWMYPEPIEDLPGWLEHNWQWFDPSHAHRSFWPDRGYRPDLKILVAGCGTNQAAALAYTNPGAHVIGIDVSAASLHHHEVLKQRFGLRNLDVHRLPIEEVASLGREFDLIVSTGVLHHLADPQVGIDSLAGCLRQDGVLALMLYAHYGRLGVEVMESVFADLRLRQDDASLAIVRDALAALPSQHPLMGYLSIAPDLNFDAGLVDTFLHGRARNFTVPECLDLVTASGLVFQDWFLKAPYEPTLTPGDAFAEAVAALPDRQRWSIMERIKTGNACHFFTACRADRPVEHYRIDLRGENLNRYVPIFRLRCGIEANELVTPSGRRELSPAQCAVAARIDARRTIEQIAADAPEQWAAAGGLPWLRALWEQDVIALGITETPIRGL